LWSGYSFISPSITSSLKAMWPSITISAVAGTGKSTARRQQLPAARRTGRRGSGSRRRLREAASPDEGKTGFDAEGQHDRHGPAQTLRCERVVAIVGKRPPTGPAGPRRTAGLRRTAVLPSSPPPRPGALRLHGDRSGPDRGDLRILGEPHSRSRPSRPERPAQLRPRRGQCRRPGPVGTTTVTITDDLPSVELQMVWKRDNTSAMLEILVETARGVAHDKGWNEAA
jgi:hypothetical protein